MAMATLTSITSLSRTFSVEDNSGNGRDASFSSYANSTFVSKLPESTRNLIPNISAQEEHHHLAGKKEDGEIGVFSAEKYFNGGMDEDSPKIDKTVPARNCHHKKDEQKDATPTKPKVHPVTPNVRSESSWNSQRALLKSVVRNPSRRKNRTYAKSLIPGLGCKCFCYAKDSVEVDEQERLGEISFNVVQGKAATKEHIKAGVDVEHKSLSPSGSSRVQDSQNFDKLGIGLNKDNCFTFPTLHSEARNLPVKKKLSEEEELKARKSLDVFGSPIYERRNKSLSIERRLKMFSWDANPRMEEIETSATSGGVYNDNESEASSDLFEIESITGKVTPFLARQGSDATSGCLTPTTCYAPSEASIEWSVVTASAADFSVMSDYEELRPPTTLPSPLKTSPTTTIAKPTTAREMPRHRSSSLLGCKSQKTVNVAGDAYKTNEKAILDTRLHRVSDSYLPVTMLQSETTLTGTDPDKGSMPLPPPTHFHGHIHHSIHNFCTFSNL